MVETRTAPADNILRNGHFLALWIAQAVSQTGQNVVLYALLIFVTEQTHSALHISALILAGIMPAVIFGTAAGVVVDQLRKKPVLIWTNLLRGGVVLLFPLLGDNLGLLYAVTFLFYTISQFFAPAEAASIPLLVRREQLITANGLFNLTMTAAQLAGLVALGPPLIKLFGTAPILLSMSLLFGLATILVALLPGSERVESRMRGLDAMALVRAFGSELREGFHLLRGDVGISLALLQLTVAVAIGLVLGELAPTFMTRVLGIRADDAVYIFAPAGVGIVLATLMSPKLAARFPKQDLINSGMIVLTLSIFALAGVSLLVGRLGSGLPNFTRLTDIGHLITAVTVVMIIALFLGTAIALITIPAQTVLLERSPEKMRARIFSVQIVFSNFASIFPLIGVAALADLIGIVEVSLILGAVLLLITAYSLIRTRSVTPLPEDVPTPPTATSVSH